MKKKVLALFMTVIMATAIFTGCGTNDKDSSAGKSVSTDTTEVQQKSWTFTDQADNEVTVQVPVKSMVVLQHH